MAYAVVDVETTGFSPRLGHRVVEVAVVQLDRAGAITGEWCTLVNPGRDLGPQHVHGVRGADARLAPPFADAAADLARLLTGRVVVGHNVRFDLRFLAAEYDRLGLDAPLDEGLCTMRLAAEHLAGRPRSLAACCAAAGIAPGAAHSALDDARACAGLLRSFFDDGLFRDGVTTPGVWPVVPGGGVRPVLRGAAGEQRPDVPPAEPLRPGDRVVFTGPVPDRDAFESRSAAAGLRVATGVSKRTTVLVAADPGSLSRKSTQAHSHGVPIVTAPTYAVMIAALEAGQSRVAAAVNA